MPSFGVRVNDVRPEGFHTFYDAESHHCEVGGAEVRLHGLGFQAFYGPQERDPFRASFSCKHYPCYPRMPRHRSMRLP